MKIAEMGTLSRAQPDTRRAVLTFPSVIRLRSGTLLATYRAGSDKDSDDATIEFCHSQDGGRTWSSPRRPFANPVVEGKQGTLRVCYLTEAAAGRLLAAALWVDRTTYPGCSLFNTETEGCLPMAVLLAESDDGGDRWSSWRVVPVPEEVGPPSLTGPILQLADGGLALSIETNKHYLDRSRWMQKALFFHSHDGGETWHEPFIAAADATGRIFNWDLRCGVAPYGRVVTYSWTYDSQESRYLNILRRISRDHGQTWGEAEDLGIADQPSRPAIRPDGSVVLAFVDRFQTHTIRARWAPAIDSPFESEDEVVLYTHTDPATPDNNTGELLSEMNVWSFGLPYAEALADGDVYVVYYAGDSRAMDIHWARLQV